MKSDGSGTLILSHHNVIHGAAPNHSKRIGMAGFQRFAHRDVETIGQSGLSDIWKTYPNLRDIGPIHHDAH